MLVRGRELQTAHDIASVLSDRVHRWTTAATYNRRQDGPAFIAGLLPQAQLITVADLNRALTQRAQAIEHRARTLAEHAITHHAAWARTLGPPPADPARYQRWLRHVATVAAFHDRWNTAGNSIQAATDRSNIERDKDAEHAKLAATRARRIAQSSDPIGEVIGSDEDLRPAVDHGALTI